MLHEYIVRTKKPIECVYVTKDNIEECIKKYGSSIGKSSVEKYELMENGEIVVLYSSNIKRYVYLDSFYVQEIGGWKRYTKEQFNEYYVIDRELF